MATDARSDVDHGVRHLRDIIRRHQRQRQRQRWLLVYIREAVRQLHRSYVTLAGEVTLLGGTATGAPAGLERISRSQLVHRIHTSGGDFALIARLCHSLKSIANPGLGVEETEAVLRRWANRDVHLFRILVPLANFAEELQADVSDVLGSPEPSGLLLDACLKNAHRAMAPVFRELTLTARGLHLFAREFEGLVPRMLPDEVPVARGPVPASRM